MYLGGLERDSSGEGGFGDRHFARSQLGPVSSK